MVGPKALGWEEAGQARRFMKKLELSKPAGVRCEVRERQPWVVQGL
jgi:hypothetical protein